MPSRYHWQSQRSCECRNSCIFLDNITKSYWPLWFSPCVLDTFQFSAYQYFICACVQSHAHIPYKLCINYLSECLKKKILCVCQKTYTWNYFQAENGRHCINGRHPIDILFISGWHKNPHGLLHFSDYSVQRYFLLASSSFLRACETLVPVVSFVK